MLCTYKFEIAYDYAGRFQIDFHEPHVCACQNSISLFPPSPFRYEPHLLWIAEELAVAPLPDGWQIAQDNVSEHLRED